VVCNVSSAIVVTVRRRYANVVTVLVTAPREELRRRLAARERASDGRIADRMNRSEIADVRPDVVIHNVGEPEAGARRLLDAVYATGVFAN
jgi:ribose 1,5-bisphosphokinase